MLSLVHNAAPANSLWPPPLLPPSLVLFLLLLQAAGAESIQAVIDERADRAELTGIPCCSMRACN